jgi:hypothetical protein
MGNIENIKTDLLYTLLGLSKSKGNPGKNKKGRAAYKDQQQKLYDRMPPSYRNSKGGDSDHEVASGEAYDKALTQPRPGAHPPGEEYRYYGYDTEAEGQEEYDKHYGEAMKRIKRSQIKGGAEKPWKRQMEAESER